MSKCEWKDGLFYQCEGFDNLYCMDNKSGIVRENESDCHRDINYCHYCGSDIRKPEPEVIIKKSGGTWVARFEDIDLFCFNPHFLDNPDALRNQKLNMVNGNHKQNWKPISEIEITDEIAKLRPLITEKHNLTELLLYVNDKGTLYTDADRHHSICCSGVRLATVSDLN